MKKWMLCIFALASVITLAGQTVPQTEGAIASATLITNVVAGQCQNCTVNDKVNYQHNTAGDALIVGVVHPNGVSITGVTDSAGNTYPATADCITQLQSDPTYGYSIAFYHAFGIHSSSNNTISVAAGGSIPYFTVLTAELKASSYIACGTLATGASTAPSAIINATAANQYVIGYASAGADIGCNPGQLLSVANPATGDVLCFVFSSGSGSQTVNFTRQSAGGWYTTGVVYQ